MSVNSPTMKGLSGSITCDNWYWYDGSLKDEEWAAWCEANPLLRILEPKERDQLRYMTGGQPLLVDILALPFVNKDVSQEQYSPANSANNLKQAVDAYYGEGDIMSYFWMRSQVQNTLRSIMDATPDGLAGHIEMMIASLAHLPTDNIVQLYDHRFFHYDETTRLLRCFCGFAEDALRHLLYNSQREQYMKKLGALWAERNKLYEMNPSVLGFAFEELVLGMLPINYQLLLPELLTDVESSRPDIVVTVFEGDYSSEGLLNREGIELYRPSMWNVRYVDAVIRVYVPTKASMV